MESRQWLKDNGGEHLPGFMRDFHNQKDLFKAMEQIFAPCEETKAHTWRSNHIFTVDFFLHFMAIHGYTLQRARKKGVKFNDIAETVSAQNEVRARMFAKMMEGGLGGR